MLRGLQLPHIQFLALPCTTHIIRFVDNRRIQPLAFGVESFRAGVIPMEPNDIFLIRIVYGDQPLLPTCLTLLILRTISQLKFNYLSSDFIQVTLMNDTSLSITYN
jgi:hypothetical protein